MLKNFYLIKELALPIGACLFTVGNLWHTKENQEFEQKKHKEERADKYWDKRLGFYYRLVAIIRKEPDVSPEELNKVKSEFQDLTIEGEILFNSEVGQLVKKIKEQMGDRFRCKLEQQGPSKIERALKRLDVEKNIELIFEDCKEKIISSLRIQVASGGVTGSVRLRS